MNKIHLLLVATVLAYICVPTLSMCAMDGRLDQERRAQDALDRVVEIPALNEEIIAAVETGNIDVVRRALDQGLIDIRSTNKRGSTLLFFAPCKKAPHQSAAMVDMLIERSADINAHNSLGKSPLWFFCDSGQVEVVNKLIELKAAIDDDGQYEGTPLARAINQGHDEVAQALLAHKANPNIADKKGFTPLMWAAMGKRGDDPAITASLLVYGADVMAQNGDKQTALRFAVHREHNKVAKALLETGKVTDFVAIDGCPLLISAVGKGNSELAELMLTHGADIHMPNGGQTPLRKAFEMGKVDMVKMLLFFGAHVDELSADLEKIERAEEHGDSAGLDTVQTIKMGQEIKDVVMLREMLGTQNWLPEYLVERSLLGDILLPELHSVVAEHATQYMSGVSGELFNRLIKEHIERVQWLQSHGGVLAECAAYAPEVVVREVLVQKRLLQDAQDKNPKDDEEKGCDD